MKYKFYGKKQMAWRYGFAFVVIVAGIIFNSVGLGTEFFAYGSVGNYLIFVGLLMLFITTLFYLTKRERIIDERMEKMGYKASRVTFLILIVAAFAIMILDGVRTITLPYQVFMSYLISGMLVVYLIAYKFIERKS